MKKGFLRLTSVLIFTIQAASSIYAGGGTEIGDPNVFQELQKAVDRLAQYDSSANFVYASAEALSAIGSAAYSGRGDVSYFVREFEIRRGSADKIASTLSSKTSEINDPGSRAMLESVIRNIHHEGTRTERGTVTYWVARVARYESFLTSDMAPSLRSVATTLFAKSSEERTKIKAILTQIQNDPNLIAESKQEEFRALQAKIQELDQQAKTNQSALDQINVNLRTAKSEQDGVQTKIKEATEALRQQKEAFDLQIGKNQQAIDAQADKNQTAIEAAKTALMELPALLMPTRARNALQYQWIGIPEKYPLDFKIALQDAVNQAIRESLQGVKKVLKNWNEADPGFLVQVNVRKIERRKPWFRAERVTFQAEIVFNSETDRERIQLNPIVVDLQLRNKKGRIFLKSKPADSTVRIAKNLAVQLPAILERASNRELQELRTSAIYKCAQELLAIGNALNPSTPASEGGKLI